MAEDLSLSPMPEIGQAENAPPKNLIKDIFGIILDPTNTFKRVLAIGYWVGIFIILCLFAVAMEQATHTQLINMTIQKMQENAGDNSAQVQAAMSFYENQAITRPVYGAISVIGQLVYLLIFTVLYFFIGSVIFGGTAKFKQVWIVTCWSAVIMLIGMVVKTPLVLIKDNFQTGINLGLFFSEDLIGSKLHNALVNIDLFGVWHFIVAGIGLAVLYKFNNKKGISISFIVWLLLTLVAFVSGYMS